jgi:hypothetical protein
MSQTGLYTSTNNTQSLQQTCFPVSNAKNTGTHDAQILTCPPFDRPDKLGKVRKLDSNDSVLAGCGATS